MTKPAFDYRSLSVDERLELVGDIWDSIADEANANADLLPLTEEQKAELDRPVLRPFGLAYLHVIEARSEAFDWRALLSLASGAQHGRPRHVLRRRRARLHRLPHARTLTGDNPFNIDQAGTFTLGDRTVKQLGYGAAEQAALIRQSDACVVIG